MSFTEQDVLKAKQGNREEFVRLIRQLENGLYSVARSMVKREEDIADALQETIMKAYQSLETLREPAFFKTWVYRILINECHWILRRRSRTVGLESLPEVVDSQDQTANVDLRMAIDQLDEQQRLILNLYYFQDMSIQMVADTLQITISAVKTRLHRARKSLMVELGHDGEEGGQTYELF